MEFESQSNKQKVRECSSALRDPAASSARENLDSTTRVRRTISPGEAAPDYREAELTAQEGHGPEGLLHEDLGDWGQVVVCVVGHHDA